VTEKKTMDGTFAAGRAAAAVLLGLVVFVSCGLCLNGGKF
jgi:hypothetical protein